MWRNGRTRHAVRKTRPRPDQNATPRQSAVPFVKPQDRLAGPGESLPRQAHASRPALKPHRKTASISRTMVVDRQLSRSPRVSTRRPKRAGTITVGSPPKAT